MGARRGSAGSLRLKRQAHAPTADGNETIWLMAESSEKPTNMPAKGDGGATQLSILLDATTALIDEEFKRSERLDAKSRSLITIAGSFFAIVQVVVVGLINGSLGPTETEAASSFVFWLAVVGGLATVSLVVALFLSYNAWKLRDDQALKVKTIRDYRDAARAGNPGVGAKLVDAYADIADDRRKNNANRAEAVGDAAIACGIAMALIGIELVLAFVAVAVQ